MALERIATDFSTRVPAVLLACAFAVSSPLAAQENPSGPAPPVLPAWTADLPFPPSGAPVVAVTPAGPRVYQPLADGRVFSAALGTGADPATETLGEARLLGLLVRRGRLWWSGEDGSAGWRDLPALGGGESWDLGVPCRGAPLATPHGVVVTGTGGLTLLAEGSVEPVGVVAWQGEAVTAPSVLGDELAVPVARGGGGEVLLVRVLGSGMEIAASLGVEAPPTAVALGDEMLFVGDAAGRLTAFRRRGRGLGAWRRIWRRRGNGPYAAPPVFLYRGVAAISLDNWLDWLDRHEGVPWQRLRIPRRVVRPMLPLGAGRLVLTPLASAEILEADLIAGVLGRRWGTGEGYETVQTAPVLGPGMEWMVATFGPWRWRLAGFDLRAGPAHPEAEGAPAPEGGDGGEAEDAVEDEGTAE